MMVEWYGEVSGLVTGRRAVGFDDVDGDDDDGSDGRHTPSSLRAASLGLQDDMRLM